MSVASLVFLTEKWKYLQQIVLLLIKGLFFMLEVVGSSQKEAIFKNFKNLLVNFRLTTVINLHQAIFTQN